VRACARKSQKPGLDVRDLLLGRDKFTA
jgi:hypothetical protein